MPMWMMVAESFGFAIEGNHGTSASITTITSASDTRGSETYPKCSGWWLGKFIYIGAGVTTGMAQLSASSTRALTALGWAPTRWVTMSGELARAKACAASLMRSGAGYRGDST